MGQSLYVLGNIVELGNWQVLQAKKMQQQKQHYWTIDINVTLLDNNIEYQYFIAQENYPLQQIQYLSNKLKIEFSQLRNINDSINVMTFNIRFDTEKDGKNQWQFRKEFVIDMIKTYQPIIIGFQEVLNHQNQYLIENLMNYNMIGRGCRKQFWDCEGCPIFYRIDYQLINSEIFWLSQTPNKPGSNQYGNRIPRVCTVIKIRKIIQHNNQDQNNLQIINIYNCHFDHKNLESREQSAKQIKQHIDKFCQNNERIILMGDFNCLFQDPPIDIIQNQGIQLNNTTNQQEQALATFHSWKGKKIGKHIDFIFIDNQTKLNWMKIDTKNYNGNYPSDHFPKIINIKI